MQQPILHAHTSISERGILLIMRYNDKRGKSFLAQAGHELIEDAAVVAVEVAARFISKNQLWVIHQGTGNGDPLLFAAGELGGKVFKTLTESETGKEFPGMIFLLAGAFP